MYTRRQFLQLTGIALVGSQLSPAARWFQPLTAPMAQQGRALMAATIYAQAAVVAAPVARLWPDSVTPILAADSAWYQLPDGFTPRAALQPMKPVVADLPVAPTATPFWAEVAGPVASVRRYCAANAPLVTRIGHGGIMRVVDYLPDSSSPWYGVALDDGTPLGWTQAVHWRQVADSRLAGSVTLELDNRLQQLTVWDENHAVLHAPCSIGQAVAQGDYRISARETGGGTLQRASEPACFGVPWRVSFGDYELVGAYWHNDFGAQLPGATVQVTPLLAEWLYTNADRIVVV